MNKFHRLRQTENLRKLARETSISLNSLIYPLFVVHGKRIKKPIKSMPGCFHFSVDALIKEVEELKKLGLSHIILFGIPKIKNEKAKEAYLENGIVQTAIREIKKSVKDITVITDVCLCEYTSHGHCAILTRNNKINYTETLDTLAKTAVSHAKAGADIVAPSDMMDKRVFAIREALDKNGFENLPIMAYSAKFASAFYGPFRDAADSTPAFGDRRSYQMDYHNRREAIREILADIEEKADIVMVKPALSYLDIIREARNVFNHPIAAYNVSGEYSMVKATGSKGWLDEKKIVFEILTSIKRAGADIIITYHAKDVAKWLKGSTQSF